MNEESTGNVYSQICSRFHCTGSLKMQETQRVVQLCILSFMGRHGGAKLNMGEDTCCQNFCISSAFIISRGRGNSFLPPDDGYDSLLVTSVCIRTNHHF